MPTLRRRGGVFALGQLVALSLLGTGCVTTQPCRECTDVCLAAPVPRELKKATLPTYVIEPPDELVLNASRLVPLPPYHIQPLDVLRIQVPEAKLGEPINDLFAVDPDGTIDLGFSYGSVRVDGMTIEQARVAIEKELDKTLAKAKANVSLAQSKAMQQIQGPHLVRPDGTVVLGTYGSVYVTGMTLREAKEAVEAHLSQFLLKPEIALDIAGMNSKVFYIVSDNAGFGATVIRRPITGNETVLDALSDIGGVPSVGSKKKIWVARPAPADVCGEQILPVDFNAIVMGGRTATNYQLMPGDRLYIHSDFLLCTDNWLSKAFAPVERIFGITVFGSGVIRSLSGRNAGGFLGNNNTGGVTNVINTTTGR